MERTTELLLVLIGLTARCLVGLWGHSGEAKPPMYGDYEAQRHWMEITTSLPISDWYRQTEHNDLMYWGLDYPPLTAYVSCLFGKIAEVLCPDLVALHSSRGNEELLGKLYMRGTVMVCDVLVIIPAILLLTRQVMQHENINSSSTAKNPSLTIRVDRIRHHFLSLMNLISPGLLLIDHGHFQYNGVCIGLTLLACYFILLDYDIVGSVFFCLSLNFKQMSLYYALVFFCVLLRKCFIGKNNEYATITAAAKKLVVLGITVIFTFSVLWYPFCIYADGNETCLNSLVLVLQRQFPFSRGIFEDKVSNIWYTVSVISDIRQYFAEHYLIYASLGLTLLLLSPVCYNLLTRRINIERLLLALVNSSLAFFLASYQVITKLLLDQINQRSLYF